MNRQEKSALVTSIKKNLLDSSLVLILHYRGLSDKQLYDFRSNLKSKNISLKIAKNTLVKVAIEGTELEILTPYLTGPTALAYANDPVSLAKMVVSTAKENEFLKIQVGCLNNSILQKDGVETLSKLGSLEEVRATFLSRLTGVQSNFVRTISAPASSMVALLKNYASSKDNN